MGGLQYRVHKSPDGSGVQFEILEAPEIGKLLMLITGESWKYDGPGPCGLLECSNVFGHQRLIWPQQVLGAEKL